MNYCSLAIALLFLITSNVIEAQEAAPSPTGSSKNSAIGYATVEEALQSLKAKSGVSIATTKPDPWVIVTEPGTYTQWSFTPFGHYAHPAVVRRDDKQSDGEVFIEMCALCQAGRASCDKLVEEFKQLNERMRQSIQGKLNADRPK